MTNLQPSEYVKKYISIESDVPISAFDFLIEETFGYNLTTPICRAALCYHNPPRRIYWHTVKREGIYDPDTSRKFKEYSIDFAIRELKDKFWLREIRE